MKKFLALIMCTILSLSFIACNSEPDHELWQQYKTTEDPSLLFTDISVEKAVILDNDDYTITLYEQTKEDTKALIDKYNGFVIGVEIDNKTSNESVFTFTDIKVNGITLPEPEKVPFGGISFHCIAE